jgi:hypothetical protein
MIVSAEEWKWFHFLPTLNRHSLSLQHTQNVMIAVKNIVSREQQQEDEDDDDDEEDV